LWLVEVTPVDAELSVICRFVTSQVNEGRRVKITAKCTNCGAETQTVNLPSIDLPGKKWRWLSFIPTVLIFALVLPSLWTLHKPRGDCRADLAVTVLEKRMSGRGMEILGTIENHGKTRWENISLVAQFYDPNGRFLDEESDRVASAVDPGQQEHFKITLRQISPDVEADSVRTEVKVADAMSMRF
jgi:hypothetical protein